MILKYRTPFGWNWRDNLTDFEVSTWDTPLSKDGELSAQFTRITIDTTSSCKYPVCVTIHLGGNEVETHLFNTEAYLLSDNGQTVERIN